MAFFFRFLSLVALVAAIAAGAIDAVLSVSSSSVVLTSLEADWVAFDPGSLALVEAWVTHYIHPEAWQSGLAVIIQQPAFAVFLVLSLVLWMIGYRRATLGALSA